MPKDKTSYKDFVWSIKETKENVWDEFDDADREKEFAKGYHPYLITRSLISHKNILLLNELNKNPLFNSEPTFKKLHHDYLLHAIPDGQEYKTVSMSKEKKREKEMEALRKEVKKTAGIGGKGRPLKF